MVYSRDEEIVMFEEVTAELRRVHVIKSSTYQDSWRKRGELVSVFGNVARKFDRIEKIVTDPKKWAAALKNELAESIEDTIIDLAVYCTLWCTLLKLERPEAYNDALGRALGTQKINTGGKDGED